MLLRLAPSIIAVNRRLALFCTKLFNGTTKKDLSQAKHLILLKKSPPRYACNHGGRRACSRWAGYAMPASHDYVTALHNSAMVDNPLFQRGNFGITAKKSRLHGDYIQAIDAHIEHNVLIIQVFCRLGFAMWALLRLIEHKSMSSAEDKQQRATGIRYRKPKIQTSSPRRRIQDKRQNLVDCFC